MAGKVSNEMSSRNLQIVCVMRKAVHSQRNTQAGMQKTQPPSKPREGGKILYFSITVNKHLTKQPEGRKICFGPGFQSCQSVIADRGADEMRHAHWS